MTIYLDKIINWIKQEVQRANALGVVVGVSGGIDSALVAYLAKQAFPTNCLAILMPISSDRQQDLEDGLKLVKKFDIDYKIIDLKKEYEQVVQNLNIKSELVKGNIQSRLRMTTLYAISQEKKYLVLGTDNRSEYELGFFTKWGDGACDLQPIIQLYKSEVYECAKIAGVPNEILNKEPSAGFVADQTDEKDLGFTYQDFEDYKKGKLNNPDLIQRIQNQIRQTEHKRRPVMHGPEKE